MRRRENKTTSCLSERLLDWNFVILYAFAMNSSMRGKSMSCSVFFLTSCELEFHTLQFVTGRGCVNRFLDQTSLGSVISIIFPWSKAHAYAWLKHLCVGPLSYASCAGQPRTENRPYLLCSKRTLLHGTEYLIPSGSPLIHCDKQQW